MNNNSLFCTIFSHFIFVFVDLNNIDLVNESILLKLENSDRKRASKKTSEQSRIIKRVFCVVSMLVMVG